jgi:HK97 family phage portal protein
MFHWIKKSLLSQKSKSTRPSYGYGYHSSPIWTPRQYDRLAEEGYQKNVIVYRAVNLIARNAASVDWRLYHKDHEITHHPLVSLLTQPNPLQTQASFVEAIAGHMMLAGNAYVEAVGSGGEIQELYLLRPDRVRIIPGKGGIPQGYEYTVNGYKREIPVDPLTGKSAVLHLKSFHPLNDWYGMSPIEAAASSIDQHNAVGAHNLALLQNGGRPTGALVLKTTGTYDGMLTPDQREKLKEEVREAYSGKDNAGRMMVLEGDMEWREMGLTPKDLDFIAGKHLSSREIAQAYGVPPMLVGVPGDSTFSNYKEARFHLWEDTILPLVDTIISEINRWIVSPTDPHLKFAYDIDSIPALALRREPIWARLKDADFLTINEKRQALGYSPMDGGDML